MSQTTFTPPVTHKFARAKAQLKRDDTLRALAAMLAGLDEFKPKSMPGKARFEVEVLILECVQELNRQPLVRTLFENLARSRNAHIPYTPGEEKKLKGVLDIIHKALHASIAAKKESAEDMKLQRKTQLEQKGLEYLRSGDVARGRSFLRVLAEEYGKEDGVLLQVGDWFMEQKLYFEAAEMLELAMNAFPKQSKAYALAAQCYIELREFKKCESVYLRAIKQFGKHPRTQLNLAKLYLAWNRKEQAFYAAREAYAKDKSLVEAKEIIDKYA